MKKVTKFELEEVIKCSSHYSEAFKHLGWCRSTRNYEYIKRLVREWDIDISHFRKQHSTGIKDKLPDEKIFCENSEVSQATLRRRARDILRPIVCVDCGNKGEHNGKLLVLQLDHNNGIRDDNRKENLKWRCPNCHSQTDTYSMRKKIKVKKEKERNLPRFNRRKVNYNLVIAKVENGESMNSVAKQMKVSQRAIAKIIKKYAGVAPTG